MTDTRRGADVKGRGHKRVPVSAGTQRRRKKNIDFRLSELVSSGNKEQPEPQFRPLPRDKKREIKSVYNYHALGEKLANEHLVLSIHPTYQNDPKIAKRIDSLYGGAEDMLKGLHGIVHLQNELAKDELGMALMTELALENAKRHMEERFFITAIPALLDVYTKIRSRVETLKRFEKKHRVEEFNFNS